MTVTGYRMQKSTSFTAGSSVAQTLLHHDGRLIQQRLVARDDDGVTRLQAAFDHLSESFVRPPRLDGEHAGLPILHHEDHLVPPPDDHGVFRDKETLPRLPVSDRHAREHPRLQEAIGEVIDLDPHGKVPARHVGLGDDVGDPTPEDPTGIRIYREGRLISLPYPADVPLVDGDHDVDDVDVHQVRDLPPLLDPLTDLGVLLHQVAAEGGYHGRPAELVRDSAQGLLRRFLLRLGRPPGRPPPLELRRPRWGPPQP